MNSTSGPSKIYHMFVGLYGLAVIGVKGLSREANGLVSLPRNGLRG